MRAKKPPILNTVRCYGIDDKNPPPSCMGCLPTDGTSAIIVPVPARYRIVSTAYGVDLCTACAVSMIKSLAARFAMYERSATRDLMDFFAVNIRLPPKKRRRRKKTSTTELITNSDGFRPGKGENPGSQCGGKLNAARL